MSSIFSTGTSALLAFQRALNTVGHNVANANTPGYSRQRVEMANMQGRAYGFGTVGGGVSISGITRIADQYNYARALDNAAELGRLGQLAGMSGRVDQMLSADATSLAGPWSNFFDSLQAVSSAPGSTASRQAMLSDANALANRFSSLDAQLKSMYSEVNGKITSSVADANQLTSEIARLNQEIVRQQGMSGGNPPNDLLDQRERLVSDLSARLGVNVAMQDDGAMNVFMPSGQALVVGTTTMKLTTVADPFQPGRREVAIQGSTGAVRLGASALGGELGGLASFRSDVLDPASAQLGRLAVSLSSSFNAQHRQGIDLNGQPGGDLFAPLQPRASAHAGNTGSATITTAVGDLSGYDGSDVLLAFNGTAWSATSRSSGQPLPLAGTGTAGDPLRVGGMELVVGGAPAAGDRFLLEPASGLAGSMRVAISDPTRIAAASPLAVGADLANLGNASPAGLAIGDMGTPGFGTPANIEFLDSNTYTINGDGPFAYDPAAGIQGPGWTLRLDGSPMAGDRFDVGPRGPGSTDNGNMLSLAGLGGLDLLGGSSSMNGALAQLSVFAGASARQAGYAFEAQSAIGVQITAERESVSGVNLDEEAANLMRYQQAYMAAAQLLSTADEMFQSLLQAVRR